MLEKRERRRAFRTIEGWAHFVLLEAEAIHECEEHGWAKEYGDPHARARAFLSACEEPPFGMSPTAAVKVLEEVLASIGDVCPECPSETG